jgi:hypothetical protein
MKKKNKEISIVRSSAAEYLTFVASSGNGGVETDMLMKMSGSHKR